MVVSEDGAMTEWVPAFPRRGCGANCSLIVFLHELDFLRRKWAVVNNYGKGLLSWHR